MGDPVVDLTVVVGAGGHVGTSTFAAAFASRVCGGASAILVDADRYGGGLDVLLGMEHVPGARWPAVARAGADVLPADVIAALPQSRGGFSLLSCDRGLGRIDDAAAEHVLLQFASTASVVVDVSRDWDSPVARAAIQHATRHVIVMTTAIRSCAAALLLLELLQDSLTQPVAAVRELPRGASLASLRRSFPVPVITRVPHNVKMSRRLDAGDITALQVRNLQAAVGRVLPEGAGLRGRP